jgi:hypothetical protein
VGHEDEEAEVVYGEVLPPQGTRSTIGAAVSVSGVVPWMNFGDADIG